MATNYFDIILERLKIILKTALPGSIQIYNSDTDKIKDSLSIIKGNLQELSRWATDYRADRFHFQLKLRLKYTKNSDRTELLDKYLHTIIVALPISDTTTNWFDAKINSENIEIEEDENGIKTHWLRTINFSCMLAYKKE
jgi:hypothetical protein